MIRYFILEWKSGRMLQVSGANKRLEFDVFGFYGRIEGLHRCYEVDEEGAAL